MSDQRPPYDPNAEAAVLSAMLIAPERADDVRELAPVDAYYSEAHRRIAEAILTLRDERRPIDIVTVGSWLRDRNRLDQVGGMPYLTELLNAAHAVTRERAVAYAEKVGDRWRRRRLLRAAQELVARCYAGEDETDALADAHAAAVTAIADARPQDTLMRIGEAARLAIAEVKAAEAARREGRSPAIPTSLRAVDRALGGWHRGDLTIVAARPGMGKSALAFQESLAGAEQGYASTGFSLEMKKQQIALRQMCERGNVSVFRARRGTLSAVDWQNLQTGAERLYRLPFWVDDKAGITLPEARARLRTVEREAKSEGRRLGLVVFDYIQLAKAVGAGETGGRKATQQNREQQVAEISRGLKELAKDFDVPVLALSQLSRAVELRQDKRPQLSDLRESGALEQDADNIVFIYRDDYYDQESKLRGVAELIVAKQRNGPTYTEFVRWQKKTASFRELTASERDRADLPPPREPRAQNQDGEDGDTNDGED